MNIEKCSGESKIVFTSPGEFGIDLMYKLKGEKLQITRIKKEDIPPSFIQVSSPEVLHQIRTQNITYGLALFLLGFGLFNLLKAIW